ncbi:MAG: hypothetical protein P8179_10810 [Candidatus Thiodiazotropha sp.]|jgi:hypothetical protein
MKLLTKILFLSMIGLFTSTMSACAEMSEKQKPKPETSDTDHFTYSIKVNSNTGEFSILDNHGRRVERERTNFPEKPIPVKSIINYHTIIEAEGSCLVIFDGEVFNTCFQ